MQELINRFMIALDDGLLERAVFAELVSARLHVFQQVTLEEHKLEQS